MRSLFISLLILGVSSPAPADRPVPAENMPMVPCQDYRGWPMDFPREEQMQPFNMVLWLPPIDSNFNYNLCRDFAIGGGVPNQTECMLLDQVDEPTPVPWPGDVLSPFAMNRSDMADDEDWVNFLTARDPCWEVRALGDNGPVDQLGWVCPGAAADSEAPEAPGVTATSSRPVFGTGGSGASAVDGMAEEPMNCSNFFSHQAGEGNRRLEIQRPEGEEGQLIVEAKVFAGDDLLLHSARPFEERLTIKFNADAHEPQNLKAQVRLIDIAGQASEWTEIDGFTDERGSGCACNSAEPLGVALFLVCLSLLRRRRPQA